LKICLRWLVSGKHKALKSPTQTRFNSFTADL